MNFIEKIKANPRTKEFVLLLLMPRGEARPRWWVRNFINPFYHKRGKRSLIRRTARMDVMPFRKFEIGDRTIIEDFTCINNGIGDIIIGHNVTIGIGSVLIGPVTIGNNVIMAQHAGVSGLNHGYTDINIPIRDQKCTTRPIIIEDDCWIGTNTVITAGVTIGKHAVVAGGSVVTKDVPPFSIVGGNPASILKQYNAVSGLWEKPEKPTGM